MRRRMCRRKYGGVVSLFRGTRPARGSRNRGGGVEMEMEREREREMVLEWGRREEVRERFRCIVRGSEILPSGEWSVSDLMGRYCRILKKLRGRGKMFDIRKPQSRVFRGCYYSLFADISILGNTRLL